MINDNGNSAMSVYEFQRKRNRLCADIADLLQVFEEQTDMTISAVDVDRDYMHEVHYYHQSDSSMLGVAYLRTKFKVAITF